MPKFYRQNRKRIDPRYFLNETTNRDLDLEEGYDLDANDDGQLSPDGLRRMADELESGQSQEQGASGRHARGIDKMVDRLTGQGMYFGADKDSLYGSRPEDLRDVLEKVLNDPQHGWSNWDPSDFSGEKNDYAMLLKVLLEKGAKLAKQEGEGNKISLPPDEQQFYSWLRKELGYRADMGKGQWVHKDSEYA